MAYEVIVGNVGTVHYGETEADAREAFDAYKALSEHGGGRAAGEPVTLLRDGDVLDEHSPCDHDWQEQPGEPPVDVCWHCGAVRE